MSPYGEAGSLCQLIVTTTGSLNSPAASHVFPKTKLTGLASFSRLQTCVEPWLAVIVFEIDCGSTALTGMGTVLLPVLKSSNSKM